MTDICKVFFQLSDKDKAVLREHAQNTFHWSKSTFYKKVRTGGDTEYERRFFSKWFNEYFNNKINIGQHEQNG